MSSDDNAWGNDGDHYLFNNGKFGPKVLSASACPAALLEGYSRFGNKKPAEFLETWLKGEKWQWPNASQAGFLLSKDQKPITTTITLGPGVYLDRVGKEDTNYFAPFETPYAMRSLPPSSLNDEYHVYQVMKPLEVVAGPIEAGFEQPGLGTQYIAKLNPMQLVANGVLERLNEREVRRLYATR